MSGPIWRFEMHRAANGNFEGTFTDPYGWVITVHAAAATGPTGQKNLVGHGWITGFPPEDTETTQ